MKTIGKYDVCPHQLTLMLDGHHKLRVGYPTDGKYLVETIMATDVLIEMPKQGIVALGPLLYELEELRRKAHRNDWIDQFTATYGGDV